MTGAHSKTGNSPGASLRDGIAACAKARRTMLVPGVADALSARIIADLGFEAVYVTGAGITNMDLGLPDLGFLSLPQLAEHTAAIRDAVTLPDILNLDSATHSTFITPYSSWNARANAIQIEDQASPKRCGHFEGKDMISVTPSRPSIAPWAQKVFRVPFSRVETVCGISGAGLD